MFRERDNRRPPWRSSRSNFPRKEMARRTTGGRVPRHVILLHNQAIARLDQKCKNLRKNDPQTKFLDDAPFPSDYAQQLGKALRGNDQVSCMILRASKLLGGKAVRQIKSQQVTVTEDAKVAAIKEDVDLLLNYLQTGPALRCVHIRGDSNNWGVWDGIAMNLLLEAVHENPAIKELCLVLVKVPTSLNSFLVTTKGLKKLYLGCLANSESTDEERLWVSNGISANKSLTSITINCKVEMSVAILTGLINKGEHEQLEELSVTSPSDGTSALWPVLLCYLRTKKSGSDFHLKLDGFSFEADDIKELAYGLTGSYPVEDSDRWSLVCSAPVVSKLTLCDCDFVDDGAKAAWRKFMLVEVEAIVPNESTLSSGTMPCPIRELSLETDEDDDDDDDDDDNDHNDDLTAADLVPLFCLQPPAVDSNVEQTAQGAATPMQATVGSQTQSLSVSRHHSCFVGLFQGLVDNAKHLQIQKLHIPALALDGEEGVAALVDCIVKVSSLRELDFHDDLLDSDGKLPDAIVSALKEYGHIQSVSSNVKSKIVHAYCARNQFLEQLLLESSGGSKKESEPCAPPAAFQQVPNAEKEKDSSNKTNESGGSGSDGSHEKHKSCPTLCKAAMQIPTLQLHMLTRTLLRFQESIAPATTSEGSL